VALFAGAEPSSSEYKCPCTDEKHRTIQRTRVVPPSFLDNCELYFEELKGRPDHFAGGSTRALAWVVELLMRERPAVTAGAPAGVAATR